MQEQIFQLSYAIDTFYFLMTGALVMWMAAGFAMLEAGLVRSKNATMQCLKNVALFAVAAVILVGVLARWLAGPWAAWTAAGTTVAAVEFMRRGAELLTDVPSAALLLGVVAVAWVRVRALESSRPVSATISVAAAR